MNEQASFTYDITQNRHKGNEQSVKANPSDQSKSEWHKRILAYIESWGLYGRTLKEICEQLGKQKNELSPRLTELKKDRKIAIKDGPRRLGCTVYVHTKYATEK